MSKEPEKKVEKKEFVLRIGNMGTNAPDDAEELLKNPEEKKKEEKDGRS